MALGRKSKVAAKSQEGFASRAKRGFKSWDFVPMLFFIGPCTIFYQHPSLTLSGAVALIFATYFSAKKCKMSTKYGACALDKSMKNWIIDLRFLSWGFLRSWSKFGFDDIIDIIALRKTGQIKYFHKIIIFGVSQKV